LCFVNAVLLVSVLKHQLGYYRLKTDANVEVEMKQFLKEQDTDLYEEGTEKLISQYWKLFIDILHTGDPLTHLRVFLIVSDHIAYPSLLPSFLPSGIPFFFPSFLPTYLFPPPPPPFLV
jgi:hypothetical protein